MTYASEVLADSPLLYWRLGESSGTTAADASGNGRTGTYSGSPALGAAGLLTGDADTAVTFDGSNDWVTAADTTDLTAFTVEAWIKTSSANGCVAARADGSGTNRIFFLLINSGTLMGVVRNASGTTQTATGGASVADGQVHHIALTYDGTTMRAYRDGTQVASAALAGPLSTTDRMFEVGAYGTDALAASKYTGVIDEVAYYTTALSAARVLAHYNAGIAAPPATITIHPAKITSTGTVRAPAIVPYVPPPVDGNINITAELAPARWSAAVTEPDRSAEIQPARHTAGVQS